MGSDSSSYFGPHTILDRHGVRAKGRIALGGYGVNGDEPPGSDGIHEPPEVADICMARRVNYLELDAVMLQQPAAERSEGTEPRSGSEARLTGFL